MTIKQQLYDEINQIVLQQTEINKAVMQELKSGTSTERLNQMKINLEASMKEITDTHNKVKLTIETVEPSTVKAVDRIVHDIQLLLSTIEQVQTKTDSGSIRSKSSMRSRGSSHRSSSIRMMAMEAAAEAAEKEAKLAALIEAQQAEKELAAQQHKLNEIKLRGELNAVKRKSEIFQKAAIEEEQEEYGFLSVGSVLSVVSNKPPHTENDARSKLLPPDNASQPQHAEQQAKPAPIGTFQSAPTPNPMPAAQNQPVTSNHALPHVSNHADKTPLDVIDSDDDDLPAANELNPNITVQSWNLSDRSVPSKTIHTPASEMSEISASAMNRLTTGIEQAIKSAYSMSRLPPPEPTKFFGDPLHYSDWKLSFDSLIGKQNLSSIEKLHYLKRYVGGKAEAAISGFFLLQSPQAYEKAMAALTKRFGNPFTISEAFRSKIDSWPRVGNKEGDALRLFSDFLQQCLAAMDEISELQILNDSRENKRLLQKLPEWMVLKWARHVNTYQNKHMVFPPFSVFCRFIEKEAEIACCSLFQATHINQNKPASKKTTTMVTNYEQKTRVNEKKCLYCDMTNHNTDTCFKLGKLLFKELHDFMRSKRLCYSCFEPSKHTSKDCSKPKTCRICKNSHPTALHTMKTTPKVSDGEQKTPIPPQQKHEVKPPKPVDNTKETTPVISSETKQSS